MTDYKSVRFRCEHGLLDQVDRYRTRYRCRTQIIEDSLRNYLNILAENDKRDHIAASQVSADWRAML